MLLEALEDLAHYVAGTWLACGEDDGLEAIFREYAKDHLQETR